MQPYILSSHDPQGSALRARENPGEQGLSSLLAGKRVVIVEDEGITQMQLRRILRNAGLSVLASAGNGEEGVEVILRERPDLVLMDIRMPGPLDGLEAARRILAEYRVCLIILTAFSDAEYRKKVEELGPCGYVVKPVTRETLVPYLEAAFRKFGPGPVKK